jgi:N-acetylmuramoyl-L-alanine amidase
MHSRRLLPIIFSLYFAFAGFASAFETVVIDAGHGGLDEGTEWFRVREKLITLCVAKRLENILISKGIHTVMTRRYDTYVSLDERAEMGNSRPNSLFVSIHFNAIRDTSIFGFECFYASNSGQIVARSIQDAMKERLTSRSRGVNRHEYAVLVRTNELAVLAECGFISSKMESARLQTSAAQQEIAEALALGIMRIKPLINTDPVRDLVAERAAHDRKKAEAAAAAARKKSSTKKKPAKKK